MVSVKVSLDLNKFDSCFDCFFRLSITRLHTCLRRLRLLGCWCIMQHGERRQGFPSFEKLPCQSTLQERYCLFSKLYFLCLKASQRFKSKEDSLTCNKNLLWTVRMQRIEDDKDFVEWDWLYWFYPFVHIEEAVVVSSRSWENKAVSLVIWQLKLITMGLSHWLYGSLMTCMLIKLHNLRKD